MRLRLLSGLFVFRTPLLNYLCSSNFSPLSPLSPLPLLPPRRRLLLLLLLLLLLPHPDLLPHRQRQRSSQLPRVRRSSCSRASLRRRSRRVRLRARSRRGPVRSCRDEPRSRRREGGVGGQPSSQEHLRRNDGRRRWRPLFLPCSLGRPHVPLDAGLSPELSRGRSWRVRGSAEAEVSERRLERRSSSAGKGAGGAAAGAAGGAAADSSSAASSVSAAAAAAARSSVFLAASTATATATAGASCCRCFRSRLSRGGELRGPLSRSPARSPRRLFTPSC